MKKSRLILLVLILLGVVFQTLTVFRSGLMYEYGYGFWGPTGRDLVWHQALVGQLIKSVPPENPGFAGEKLTNYHYFYDLLVAVTHRLTGISVLDLIYRIYPIIFSVLYGVGSYWLAMKLFKSRLAAILSVYFAYFAGSFGWIVEWIKFKKLGGESAFWMNQPVSMNLNPPFAISLILVIGLILIWDIYFKKPSLYKLIILFVLTFILFYFKSYAGLVMIFAFLYSCFNSLREKKIYEGLLNLLLFLVLFGLILILNRSASGSFEWNPFWLVNSAIAFPDRVGWAKLSSAIGNYLLGRNYLKLVMAETLALAIFIVGNLGVRIIGFGVVFDKKIRSNKLVLLIVFLSLVSLLPSLFFVQKGNPWNTIQFSYYFLYFASLFTGYALYRLLIILPKTVAYCLVPFALLLTPISSFTTFTFGLYPNPPAKLTSAESEALNYLKKQPDGVVLTYPYDLSLREHYINPYPLSVYTDNDYVSAFSRKAVYLGDVEQQKVLQTDYQDRLELVDNYFNNSGSLPGNVRYIYLPKIYTAGKTDANLNKIFENDEVLIYKILADKVN